MAVIHYVGTLLTFDSGGSYGTLRAPFAFTSIEGRPTETPPSVNVISPPLETRITPTEPVVIEVTHPQGQTGLGPRAIALYTVTPGATEEVFDGLAFSFPYSGSYIPIANGYRLTAYRRGGWKQLDGGVQFKARAVNWQGNEAGT